ncbi:chemotaxis protein CheW [Gemmatimonas sp.]
MTSPFRTITAFASRRRARPVIERSTFVIATAGERRVALAVECVDRVMRTTGAASVLSPAGRTLPVHDLSDMLGGAPLPTTAADAPAFTHAGARLDTRVLLVHPHAGHGTESAVRVSAVHEVYAVESVLVEPANVDTPHAWVHSAVRGVFQRAGYPVWVIDLARLLPSS